MYTHRYIPGFLTQTHTVYDHDTHTHILVPLLSCTSQLHYRGNKRENSSLYQEFVGFTHKGLQHSELHKGEGGKIGLQEFGVCEGGGGGQALHV